MSLIPEKVESLRAQLRDRTASGRRQAFTSNVVSDTGSSHITRLNSTDSAFSVSTEDRLGTRVMEMESEIKSLKVLISFIINLNSVGKFWGHRNVTFRNLPIMPLSIIRNRIENWLKQMKKCTPKSLLEVWTKEKQYCLTTIRQKPI